MITPIGLQSTDTGSSVDITSQLLKACQHLSVLHFHPSCFHFFGLARWVPNLVHCCEEPGIPSQETNFLTPARHPATNLNDVDRLHLLLESPEVCGLAASIPEAHALFRLIDENVEEKCQYLGLSLAFPPAILRDRLEDKTQAASLARRAGVPPVPQVIVKLRNFSDLRHIMLKHGWQATVVQLPQGHSGASTFFISTASDYAPHAATLAKEPFVKVAPKLNVECFALEACITSQGVSVSPLVAEITGLVELTPYPGGWCGNQIGPNGRAAELSRLAQTWAQSLGAILAQEGYRGIFGLDFLWDRDAETLYLGEVNARITGITPLLLLASGDTEPLFLQHLAEFCNLPPSPPRCMPNSQEIFSQLMMMHLGGEDALLKSAPPTGIYRLTTHGLEQVARTMNVHRLEPGQIFFLRNAPDRSILRRGFMLGRVLLHCAAVDDAGLLLPNAARLISEITKRFIIEEKQDAQTEFG